MTTKIKKSKKTMLWFTMGSIVMFFAGLTSAYLVSSSRKDWLHNYDFPSAFYYSTGLIILSSFTFHLAKKQVLTSRFTLANTFLVITLLLGLGFVYEQFQGFNDFISQGYFFTGNQSNITTSFIYAIVLAHLVHLAIALLVLLVVMYNHIRKTYSASNILGFEMGLHFWDFLGVLWLYLILFFHFV